MTINQIVYNYLKGNTAMKAAFNDLFYAINDSIDIKQPYATIFLVDDPKDVNSLCVSDQGQSRFQCDAYTTTFVKGIDKREIYQTAVKGLQAYSSNGIKIWNADIVNVVDRADTIDGLFQFSFEVIIYWEKTS